MILSEQEIFRRVSTGEMTKLEALEYFKLLNGIKQQEEETPINEPEYTQSISKNEGVADEEYIRESIAETVSGILHIPLDEISFDLTFKDLGVDSISGVEIVRDINKTFNLNMDAVVLYDFSTIPGLASHVIELTAKAEQAISGSENEGSSDIYHDPYYLKLRQKYIQKEYASDKAGEAEKQFSKAKHEDLKQELSQIILQKAQSNTHEARTNVSLSMDEDTISQKISDIVGGILHISNEDLSLDLSFKDLGVDSISGIEIVRDVNKQFNLNMDSVVLYDYPTIPELAGHVLNQIKQIGGASAEEEPKGEPGDIYHDPYYLKLRQQYLQKEHGIKEAGTIPGLKLKNNVIPPVKEEPAKSEARPLKLKNREEVYKNDSPENKKAEGIAVSEGGYPAIAITGMSGRFPNSVNLKKYWSNLRDGIDCIIEIPKERWDIDKYYDPDPKAPGKTYSRWFGMVPDADKFDPLFFNISPIEAETMDPQQRIFLEEAWKALEDAGYADKTLSNLKCGVFVGTAHSDYQQIVDGARIKNITDTFTGLSPSILPARVSYFMNLLGPGITMDTACSSSLVAIHEACKSIHTGDCEMALAGGVRLMLSPDLQIQSSKAGMVSPTGRCRAFDRDADGIVMGEGAGVIVLKLLKKAIEDGDNIHGVIKSSGVNQDGRTNGITAPSAQSQAALEQEVYRKGGINPEDITLVETHGTGTKLGDPIEVKALKEAFGKYTQKRNYCALSSVKANIGHITMAAGVASVIKVLLAMKYKQIPPLINFKKINEHIEIENSPFYINTKLIDWKTENSKPRLATVSSFGFSGTNCHMVIEEPPKL